MLKVRRPQYWAAGVVLCWLALALPGIGCAAAGGEAFAAASREFEDGDYRLALELFEEARDAGIEGAAVHYNIGVCHYRLGDHSEAEASFRALAARFPEMRDIAEYNLALTLLAQQRTAEARTLFAQTQRSGDQTLAALARRALETLGAEGQAGSRWLGSADVGLGYDDNVALADDSSLPGGETSGSAFVELVAFASGAFATSWPLRLDISGYVVRYPEAEEFDQNAVRLGSAFEWTIGGWRLGAGPHYSYSTLDGDGFERHLGFDIVMSRPLSRNTTFEWRFAQDDIQDLDPRFSFVDGSRQWLRLGIEHRAARGRLRVAYDFESNDRAGASVTSDRNRLTLRHNVRVAADWTLELAASYRTTRHAQLAAPSGERLTELSAGASRDLSAGWLLRADYYWADNDSDIAAFSYDRSRVAIGVSKAF